MTGFKLDPKKFKVHWGPKPSNSRKRRRHRLRQWRRKLAENVKHLHTTNLRVIEDPNGSGLVLEERTWYDDRKPDVLNVSLDILRGFTRASVLEHFGIEV